VSRLKLAVIFLACAAPFVLAWMAYLFGWAAGTTSNYGELIAPRNLAGPPLEPLRGKWVLVMADAAACNAYCEKKLYFMRQVRRAQGREMARIERLWLVTDAVQPASALLSAIEGTAIVSQAGGLAATFPAEGSVRDHIYLVDPLGNLMMRFPRDPDPSRVIKDLQRLLKVSGFG